MTDTIPLGQLVVRLKVPVKNMPVGTELGYRDVADAIAALGSAAFFDVVRDQQGNPIPPLTPEEIEEAQRAAQRRAKSRRLILGADFDPLWDRVEGIPDAGELEQMRQDVDAVADVPPRVEAVETKVARVDPGASGVAGQTLTIGPGGPAWLDEPVFNVKHPRFGAKGNATADDTAAIQAAIDAASAGTGLSSQQGGVVYFPRGIYTVSSLTIAAEGITFRGAGRWGSWLRSSTGDLIVLDRASKFRAESMRFQSQPGGGHVFRIVNSLSYSLFYDIWCSQSNNGKAILWGDDTVTGTDLNYIDNLWLHCETDHTEAATMASFHLRGGAVNRNRWLSMRHTYSGNYAFLLESTAASSYANDNTIDGVNFEVCTGGVVKALGAQGFVMRDIAIYDLLRSSTNHMIYLGDAATVSTRSVTLDNVRRNGFTLGASLYDVFLQGNLGRTTIQNSGGSTPLTVQANHKRLMVMGSTANVTNDANTTYVDSASTGSTFAEGATFKKQIRIAPYTTASRPSASAAGVGAMIYDTTLNKPVWSNGTAWVDASGTVV